MSSSDGIQNVTTKQSNSITNLWNKLTEGHGGNGVGLSDFGNEQSL